MPDSAVRRVWEDQTSPNDLGQQARELIAAVRGINLPLPSSQRIRVLAGDPPIDWEHVTTSEDHGRWVELRDSHPADLIRRPREQWKTVPLEQQLDALLYLGPPSAFTSVSAPPALCRDAAALAQRLNRVAIAAPPSKPSA